MRLPKSPLVTNGAGPPLGRFADLGREAWVAALEMNMLALSVGPRAGLTAAVKLANRMKSSSQRRPTRYRLLEQLCMDTLRMTGLALIPLPITNASA